MTIAAWRMPIADFCLVELISLQTDQECAFTRFGATQIGNS